jgi:C-terminal processing protease CtpA/Prc
MSSGILASPDFYSLLRLLLLPQGTSGRRKIQKRRLVLCRSPLSMGTRNPWAWRMVFACAIRVGSGSTPCSRPNRAYNPQMLRHVLASIFVAAALCSAQDTKSDRSALRSDLEPALSFEAPPSGDMPGGWTGGPAGTIFADTKVVHGGKGSARIERNAASGNEFSTITKQIPIDFAGTTIEFRGFLRTEDVSGFAGLWMREDGDSSGLAFDNMQSRQLKGTTDWTYYSIKLPLVADARKLFIGVLVVGNGKAWADDLELLVDGKPVWDLPPGKPVPTTVLDRDHQFDNGSGIVIHQLTTAQIDNLSTLGRVWGFLKYHHPKITAGDYHWDYDLFRILPSLLLAADRASANSVLARWIGGLGPISPCNPCAKLDAKDLTFGSDLGWINDEQTLGADLSRELRSVYENRSSGPQFYVLMDPGIGNPIFKHEPGYEQIKLPDAGFQLLALYRFWNIFEYWSPYRDIVGEDWSRVLKESISKVVLATTAEDYERELMAMIAKAHDGHANLWSALNARPPVGPCRIPVDVRFIENLPIVSALTSSISDKAAQLKIGDVITALDGAPTGKLIEKWKPYYATSNDAARMRDITHNMTRGTCGDAKVGIRRDDADLTLTVQRVASPAHDRDLVVHDLNGSTFRLLSKDVAYLKLSSVKAADVLHYLHDADGTRGLIIDIRNYPSQFVVFTLGSHLVDTKTDFARFTGGDLSNPGAFHWVGAESLPPESPHYSGKVVVLVDETSMSQAEYTAMAFRGAHAIIVGSTTSGADGNVSPFQLPGGLHTMISGIGVFYPDKTPTQRVGIKPDVETRPTVVGIRAGRDEVLEEAVRQLLNSNVSIEEIEKMTKP